MSYIFYKTPLGSNNKNIFFEFKENITIVDFCVVNGDIIFISGEGEIGIISKKEITYPYLYGGGKIVNPKTITYNDNDKKVYIVEGNGQSIRTIDINEKYCYELFSGDYKKNILLYFSKQGDINKEDKSYGCIGSNGEVYWTSFLTNRIYKYHNSHVNVFIGNGRSGFCVSNRLTDCMLSHPTGIAFYNNCLYFSDSKNHCIRSVDVYSNFPSMSIFCGNQDINKSLLKSPEKINMLNNYCFVLDNSEVKVISFKGRTVDRASVSGCNIKSFAIDKKDIIYLEEVQNVS